MPPAKSSVAPLATVNVPAVDVPPSTKYSEAPLARVIDPVLLKLSAPMVTASPFEMARVPELVNVLGAIGACRRSKRPLSCRCC